MTLYVDIKNIFSKIGNLMIPISILTFIGFIWSILYWFMTKNIITANIDFVISIITLISFVLVFIEIDRAGKLLKNQLLTRFNLQFIIGTILKSIGDLIIGMAISLLFGGARSNFVYLFLLLFIRYISLTTIFIAILLIIGGSILRSYAWRNLREFFETNYEFFPLDFGDFGRSGAKNCKTATKMDMLILPIFSVLANLLRLIGYLKLIRLGGLTRVSSQPKTESNILTSTPRATTSTINFCTNCGSSISPGIRFCQQCGTKIR